MTYFNGAKKQTNLQNILKNIVGIYEKLEQHILKYKINSLNLNEEKTKIIKWKAMVASVFRNLVILLWFLLSFIFYGQGLLMQAGEIINLIIRDESIHGAYIGRLAKDLYYDFTYEQQTNLKEWMDSFMEQLYQEQLNLTSALYHQVKLVDDVNAFVRYNANKALLNLGFEQKFPFEEINPVILNGLNTETKTMDNFSMKGNGYQKMISESLQDEDFVFDNEN